MQEKLIIGRTIELDQTSFCKRSKGSNIINNMAISLGKFVTAVDDSVVIEPLHKPSIPLYKGGSLGGFFLESWAAPLPWNNFYILIEPLHKPSIPLYKRGSLGGFFLESWAAPLPWNNFYILIAIPLYAPKRGVFQKALRPLLPRTWCALKQDSSSSISPENTLLSCKAQSAV